MKLREVTCKLHAPEWQKLVQNEGLHDISVQNITACLSFITSSYIAKSRR
jgi:hypothetical protein